mmetsp:Transcript_30665/g.72981  ORF Transcript_30665/g.72981 Transcript_30665/m.72981 type:complete len:206 (+) Transcript_30665:4547-5164(+)
MSVHISANQWGFIRGIDNDSLFTGPSAEAYSGRLRRSICSSIDEKYERAKSGEEPTGHESMDAIKGKLTVIKSGYLTKRVTAFKRNFVVSQEHRSPVSLESRSCQCFPSFVTNLPKYNITSRWTIGALSIENKFLRKRTTASLTLIEIFRYSKLSKLRLSRLASVSIVINFSMAAMVVSSSPTSGGTTYLEHSSSASRCILFLSL